MTAVVWFIQPYYGSLSLLKSGTSFSSVNSGSIRPRLPFFDPEGTPYILTAGLCGELLLSQATPVSMKKSVRRTLPTIHFRPFGNSSLTVDATQTNARLYET